jgi:uncharacterized protein (TIGR03083 family)
MAMSDDQLARMVASTYSALADALESAGPQAWDAPSPCEGWRVREVIAHVTMPARYDQAAFMAELSAAGFDFTKLSNTVAARDAELSGADHLDKLRSETLAGWIPPGGAVQDALSHAVIHALDATSPLGRAGDLPADAVATVLDGLAGGGGHQHFGTEIEGRSFEATDSQWSHGSGPVVRATAADLVLHLSGRRLPDGRLQAAS